MSIKFSEPENKSNSSTTLLSHHRRSPILSRITAPHTGVREEEEKKHCLGQSVASPLSVDIKSVRSRMNKGKDWDINDNHFPKLQVRDKSWKKKWS